MTVPARCPEGPVDVLLVVGGRWHDMGFARAELLAGLDGHDAARVTVRDDFSDLSAIATADAVVAYTCDVRPTTAQAQALTARVADGGRLLGLHATNSAIDAPVPGAERIFRTPDAMPEFTALLGNRFLGHPPITQVQVDVVDASDPLVAGLSSFTTTDEVYVSLWSDDAHVLLDTELTAQCRGFEQIPELTAVLPGARLPVLARRRTGGGVVYFTLGHCRGRFDVQDLGHADLGMRDRIAWESPGYREVLGRCLAWAVHGDSFDQQFPCHPLQEGS